MSSKRTFLNRIKTRQKITIQGRSKTYTVKFNKTISIPEEDCLNNFQINSLKNRGDLSEVETPVAKSKSKTKQKSKPKSDSKTQVDQKTTEVPKNQED